MGKVDLAHDMVKLALGQSCYDVAESGGIMDMLRLAHVQCC